MVSYPLERSVIDKMFINELQELNSYGGGPLPLLEVHWYGIIQWYIVRSTSTAIWKHV